jgi:hypothetical protein
MHCLESVTVVSDSCCNKPPCTPGSKFCALKIQTQNEQVSKYQNRSHHYEWDRISRRIPRNDSISDSEGCEVLGSMEDNEYCISTRFVDVKQVREYHAIGRHKSEKIWK